MSCRSIDGFDSIVYRKVLESADNILRNQRVQPKMSSVDTITAHGQRRKVYVAASDTSDSNTPNTGKAENNGKSCSMVTTMVTTTLAKRCNPSLRTTTPVYIMTKMIERAQCSISIIFA